jgi:Glu-tRNA(Gln) amidotransferase subunit E-like FAD-binding protein
VTGDELAALDEPRMGLGIFCPESVVDECNTLARQLGTAVGGYEIPPISRTKLGECIAVLVMYPKLEGRTAAEILGDSLERWSTPDVQAKIDDFADKHGESAKDRAMTVMREIMEAMLTTLGDRTMPPEANEALVFAGAFISDHAAQV